MFKSWGSLGSVLHRQKKRRNSECSITHERSALSSTTGRPLRSVPEEKTKRSVSTVSSPCRIHATTVDRDTFQRQMMHHGFTPARIEAPPPSLPVDIKKNKRKVSIKENSSSESSRHGSSGRKISANSPTHLKMWEQAYVYGCR